MHRSFTRSLALGASALAGVLALSTDGAARAGVNAFVCGLDWVSSHARTATTATASTWSDWFTGSVAAATDADRRTLLPLISNRTGVLPPVTARDRWSDPATWNGRVPQAGDAVIIPAGKAVLLDVDPPALKSLTIDGALVFDRRDTALTAGWIVVHGGLHIGSSTQPFTNNATITLTATDPAENVMNMGTRGIMVMGGRFELFGNAPAVPWTKLDDHAAANASSLTLTTPVGWKAGDQLALAPTDFYDGNFIDTPQTEQLTVASVNNNRVTLQSPVARARWGKLQYVTDSGMAMTQGTVTLPATNGKRVPTVLDQRAEVANLTRNIIIQGADDTLWRTSGFGGHVMIMDRKANVALDGVELRRMGQAGIFGRYPIHFHNLSYSSTGAELGDVTYSVRNSVVRESSQRCVVIHGSNGITLEKNICYDVKGHGIFLEDAVERRNQIIGNLVLKVRQPEKPLLKHEGNDAFGGTSSGFWLVNPDNVVRGNVAADIVGHGYWLAYPDQTLGSNKNVKIRPDNLPFGVFEDNVAHSVGDNGVFLDAVPTSSDVGETKGNKYIPTVNGEPDRYDDNRLRFTLARITVYKVGSYWGGGGGIWNRNSNPDFLEWVVSDSMGGYFAGAGDNGNIERGLVIGESLNNVIPRVSTQPLAAMASYHSTFDIKQNLIVGFPFVEKDNASAGAFRTDDYYITGVDKGLVRNPDNKLINSVPGRRVQPFTTENWTIAGALWDPHGYWGPKNNYWVYDTPFFTSGATCQQVVPAGKNGASCNGQYYGVGDYLTDFDTNRYSFKAPIRVQRQDASGAEIGTWEVGDGNTAPKLGNMRHFAARDGGRYLLTFPGNPIPARQVFFQITNAYRPEDDFVLGVSFAGSTDAVVSLGTAPNTRENYSIPDTHFNAPYRRKMVPLADLAAVTASENGYWHDKANNVMWIKIKGGLPYSNANDFVKNPVGDAALYRPLWIEVFPKP